MQTRSNNAGEEQKQEALTNSASSVTLEMKKQLAEAIMNLTSPQAAYVLRRLQCLLQSEN